MNILALDTSGVSESVAISRDGEIVWETFQESVSSHTVSLLGSIQEGLKKSGIDLGEIDFFAVTMGPGSFTGLRIGISTVKAFSRIFQKPVVAISTLEALAWPHLRGESIVVPCIDARMGEVYASAYQKRGDDIQTVLEPEAQGTKELVEKLKEESGEKILLGSGIRVYPEIFSQITGAISPNSEGGEAVRAAEVAKIAGKMIGEGKVVLGRELRPAYLRVSTAEKKLFDKRGCN